MQQSVSVRTLAAQALDRWEKGHVYAESLVQQTSINHKLSKENRNLLNAMVMNSIRHLRLIDFWITQLRDGKLDPQTRNLLRIGLCQLHIIGIASHAAVNETVNASRKPTRGLINALLRKSLREFESLETLTKEQSIAVQYSHPDWLTERWTNQFGKEDTETLLKWNQQPARTIFRLNTLKNDVHQLLNEMENIESVPNYPDFFISKGLPPKAWLDDGLIYIQDPATSHSVNLLDPKPGETILDACAAPGGKSSQIAAAMQNAGKLLCTDSNAKRLPRLEENLHKLGATMATTEECDWLNPAPEHLHKRFDAILLDVPCSNTGVLRRRIDARWRLKPQDIYDLHRLQEKIIENAIPCLKSTGRLVYSTCSIDNDENTELIKRVLEKHPELTLVTEQQILPQQDQIDGAYAALLRLK